MTWTNADGLIVRFSKEEGVKNKAGEYNVDGALRVLEAVIDYTDMLSATSTALGGTSGPLGVIVPQGFRVEELETVVETAFTSSGTIGSATVVLGTKELNRTTEEDHDGFLTTSATGTALGLATVGTKTTIKVGSTGAGALLGANTADAGYLCVANSAHASHPYTAGRLIVRIKLRPAQTA